MNVITCPHCGKSAAVNGLGRKRLNIPLKNTCEQLQAHKNVVAAAMLLLVRLGYSPASGFAIDKLAYNTEARSNTAADPVTPGCIPRFRKGFALQCIFAFKVVDG